MDNVVLPELGEGIKTATVACWHVQVGDNVEKGADLVELVTDKATFNIEASVAGRLDKILFTEGDEVAIGIALAVIDTEPQTIKDL